MAVEDVTPIRKQYLDIKKKYPGAIVFFRLGDFYETFDHDAEIASKELDIVLTSRNVAKGQRVPMAGIPFHAVENYLSRLIEHGHHVAICEQVGEQPKNGLFPRQVVRIVTPGTIIESSLLPLDKNNYLVAIMLGENSGALAYADITTGVFRVTSISGPEAEQRLRAEFMRLSPAETIIPESLQKTNLPGHVTNCPDWYFDPRQAEEILLKHFRVASLDGFGVRGQSSAIEVCGALLHYLQETRPSAMATLTEFSTYSLSDFMMLDWVTRRNLELSETVREGSKKGSLLDLLDHTITAMGHRMLREWMGKPLLDIEQITRRQDGINYFLEHGVLRAEFFLLLKSIHDIERLTNRILSNYATPHDLLALSATLAVLPKINEVLSDLPTAMKKIKKNVHIFEKELELLEKGINPNAPATLVHTGVILKGFSVDLDQLIESTQHARQWIADLEKVERERTGIRSLKVGFNKVFGYYIEVTHSKSEMIPPEYIRKQTLVNAERYITPEMKEYETLILNAESRIHEMEVRLFKEICASLSTSAAKLFSTSVALAEFEVLASLAESAAIGNYCRPVLSVDTALEIHEGRHPVVETLLQGEQFIPNDTIFEAGEIIRIITGPNMAGKSTFLRQVAIIAIMAQVGSFVPAKSARIGLIDRIFTRIGAQDEIFAGQSTFMVEMTETANILHHATKRSLVILDEIGRGTSTYDGVAIAWAVVEHIHSHPELNSRTLFATHYHELTQLSEILPGVRNYNVAVIESGGKIVFLHKIVAGSSDRSYGIHVAQLAGLPNPVIQRAYEIMVNLEADSTHSAIKNMEGTADKQLALFPETSPLLDEIKDMDPNSMSPIEALNKLYEWKKKYSD
jgi:DNA mismatch repair protein MutS